MALSLKASLIGGAALGIGISIIAFTPLAGRAAPLVSRDVQMLSGDELIVMSGTGSTTVTPAQENSVIEALNYRFGTDFTTSNTDPIYTPEGTYYGTFQDDEIDLLNSMTNFKGDDVTVFGVSQSAAAVGLAIKSIETGQYPAATQVAPLPAGFSAADLPSNIHWVALAPDTMPLHDNGGGEFSYDPSGIAHSTWGNVALFPTDAGNADVFCGMYDPVCDYPTSGDNYAVENSEGGGTFGIHGNYTNLTSGEFNYETSHATEFTINNSTGSVTIYPDDNAPSNVTHFWLMPDVRNLGDPSAAYGDPGAHYDSLMPALGSDLAFGNIAGYEQSLPYATLEVDAGYDDALHPFQYMINGVDYTFYNDQVVQVADLPTGVTVPIVSEADFYGADGYLADEIAWGLVSPTGSSASEAASAAATNFGAELASASQMWTELLSWLHL